MMVQELTVQDMTCGGCAASVRQAVLQVAGVSGVEIDVPTQQVRVEATDQVTTDALVSAITAAGYNDITVGRQQAPSADPH
jgi:copper chaperone CopZ